LGDEAGALEVTEIAKVMLRSDTPYVRYHAAWYLAILSLSQSDPMGAHVWLTSFGSKERLKMFPLFPHEITDDAERVRIAAAVGDAELADQAVTLAQRRAQQNPSVVSCEAALAHCRGIWNDSGDDLARAASLYNDGKRPLAYASALEDLGRVLTQHGHNDRAVKALERALTVTTEVGATWDTARIRSRLRRLGVRRRPSSVERPKTGPGSLTTTEAVVAHLAAEGNTDRQIAEKLFISPHTAHTHLRHIFGKLGVNSRVHLSRLLDSRAGARRNASN
jgi:DNA-binding CsgD family transcriptional regulator